MGGACWVCFVAGIYPSRTCMSGSFESVRWNACVHTSVYTLIRKIFFFFFFWKGGGGGGIKSETIFTPREKSPLPEAQRRFEPATLHLAGQRAQHTTEWPIPAQTFRHSPPKILMFRHSPPKILMFRHSPPKILTNVQIFAPKQTYYCWDIRPKDIY